MFTHKQEDAIYLDQAKAFDKANVPLFIHKLRLMGMNDQILDWIAEYFNGRKELVKINANDTCFKAHGFR